jgi:hypothetical protein
MIMINGELSIVFASAGEEIFFKNQVKLHRVEYFHPAA